MLAMRLKRLDFILFSVSYLIWFVFLIFIVKQGNEWIYDCMLTFVLLTAFLLLHKRLCIHGEVLGICLFTSLLHNAGGFGLYATRFIFPFDHYMHFMAGFAIAYTLLNYFVMKKINLSRGMQFTIAIFFALGLGAAEEIVEFIFYSQGFVGEGLFFLGVGDYDPNLANSEWANLSKDLINDLLGGIIGSLVFFVRRKFSK